MKNVTLSKYYVGTPHSEYIFKIDFTVKFFNHEKGIEKNIIDCEGNILNFPDVEYSTALTEEIGEREIIPIVKYEAVFEDCDDGRIIMVWTIRPDGRYWMDSWGFGAEDYESVSLYSFLNTNGNFTSPFKLYGVGYGFCGEYKLKSDLF